MTKNITVSAIFSVISVLLFSSQMFIPFLGMAFSFLAVIPLYFIFKMAGKRYFYMSIISTFVIILFLNDPFGWIFYGLILLPATVSVIEKKAIFQIICFSLIELGSLFLYKVFFVVDGRIYELMANLWFLIGLTFYLILHFSYKRIFNFSYFLWKKNYDNNN